jgi:acetyl esterase/lipase
MMRRNLFLISVFVLALPALAQLSAPAEWATHATNEYQVFPNVTYLVASNWEAKLDIYKRRDTTGPQPTLIFFHGCGWVQGSKEASQMSLMP